MQIHNVVVTFIFKRWNDLPDIFFDGDDFVNVGVVLQNRLERLFGEVMNLAIPRLFLQTSHNRGGQHNVADRTETDDKDLFHQKNFGESTKYGGMV